MFESKMALSSYLIVLLIFAVIMTTIFIPLLGTLFKEDDKSCQNVNFNLDEVCKKNGFLIFNVENTGTTPFSYTLTNTPSSKTLVEVGETSKVRTFTEANTIDVVPITTDGFNEFVCSNKEQNIRMELVSLC